jgi:sugar phosphate isomerase/epimerase
MEVGLSTSILGPGALPDGLAVFAEHGVRWVEIHGYTLEEFDYANGRLVEATGRALDRLGLRLWSCHSPAYEPLDVCAPDARLRSWSCAAMREAMRASADLGARVFVCDAVRSGAGEPPGRVQARRALLGDSLRALLAAASRLGLRLAIENHRRGLFASPADFLGLVAEHDLAGLGACWDTGHGWLAGLPPDLACRLGERLVTLHVHENDGRRDQHRLPLSGQIAWAGFVGCLRRIGYEGPFMMEIGPPSPATGDRLRPAVGAAVEAYRRLMEAAGA